MALTTRMQGVTKRSRPSWLTNSALVYEAKCGGWGELRGLSQWVQLYTGVLTPYLTSAIECDAVCRCVMWKAWPLAGSSASQPRPSFAGSSLFLIIVLSLSFLFPSILPLTRSLPFYLFQSKSLWLVCWACSADTKDFCSALSALVGLVQNIFSLAWTISIPLSPHRPAS